jgi:hypothetical protein
MNIRTLFSLVLASAVLVLGCGGNSGLHGGGTNPLDDAGLDGGACLPLPCPSSAPWDPAYCACVPEDGGPFIVPQGNGCYNLVCPTGTFATDLNGSCVCQVSNGDDGIPDATNGDDVLNDAPYYYLDSPYAYDAPVIGYDALYYYYDAPYYGDAQPAYDASVYCNPYYSQYYCGAGYTYMQAPDAGYCTCIACTLTCPNGQTPGQGCSACVACSTACPTGFYTGPNCSCIPNGVDAGPPPDASPGPEAGVDGGFDGCTLMGYTTCARGTWCSLGTCPDGKTEYGCYCDSTGTATCNLACPAPKACNIPGLGTCLPGQQCVYGADACQGDSGTLLSCSCYSGGTAYCSSVSCAYASYYLGDGGLESGTTSDGGPSCYLEGYTQCPVGQFCALGTCPGGTSYGCTCNADGTTTCNLQCPPPPPCNIPGEGTCPYGQTCTFGTCSTGLLSCSCGYGGNVNCYTTTCYDGGAD